MYPDELPTLDTRPRSRSLCPYREATPGGCNRLHFIGGRFCCARCEERGGDHDAEAK